MPLRKIAGILLISLALSGCYGSRYTPNESIGALTGALLGGLLGAQFGSGDGRLVATGAGVFIGSLIGSDIGRSLDDADRQGLNRAVVRSHSAPIGQTIYWNTPSDRFHGGVTPIAHWTNDSGLYCRKFRQEITINGRHDVGEGVACRRPSGVWRIVR